MITASVRKLKNFVYVNRFIFSQCKFNGEVDYNPCFEIIFVLDAGPLDPSLLADLGGGGWVGGWYCHIFQIGVWI